MPRNVEAEAALLGAMMVENSIIDTIADSVRADDFFEYLHARIFDTVVSLHSQGKAANPVTVKPFFEKDEAMSLVGGVGYLASLTGSGAGLIGARDFARQIADLAKLRRLADFAASIGERARNTADEINPVALLADAETELFAVSGDEASGFEMSHGAGCIGAMLSQLDDGDRGVLCKIIPPVDDLLGGARRKQLIILAARPGMGKAQPLSARILTRAGWRTMGSLSVGDELASVDGSESIVTGIFPQGERQVYCVTLSDGRSTECCGEHLWKVRYREWSADRILSTDHIREMLTKKRYQNRLSLDLFDGDFGSADPLPLDPWLLGFLLGDGSICGGQVRFSTKDPEIVEAVQARLPADLIARYCSAYDYKITGGARGGSANSVMEALRELGVYETRSHDKFIPQVYLDANRAARIQLLRGLMDSDGWAETEGAIRFSTASAQLAEGVCELVRSIGGICSIRSRTTTYTYKGERKAGRVSHMCRIRLSDPAEVFTLQRKIDRVGRTKNTARLNISSIVPARVDQVQCISVSHPSRLYVTDSYIVTHNTAVALSYSIGAAMNGHGVLYVSLEMSSAELGARMAADLCFNGRDGVYFSDIINRRVKPADRERLKIAQGMASDLPLAVIDAGSLHVNRLGAIVRRQARRFAARGEKLSLVVVDYLQLLSADKGKGAYEAVSQISRALKALAKEQDIPVLALAQLSREVEKRTDRRPQLSDLRDSGQIEQDADTVMFLLRNEYYLRKEQPEMTSPDYMKWEQAMQDHAGKIEFICAKRRNGETGKALGAFHGAFQAVRGL